MLITKKIKSKSFNKIIYDFNWPSIILSIIVLYLSSRSGQLFKLSLIPILTYFIFSLNVKYYPAIVILSSGASIISYEVLIISFFIVFLKFKTLNKSKIRFVLYSILLFMPIIIYNFYIYLNFGLIEALTANSYFFAFFPLFYGFILGQKISNLSIHLIYLPLFLLFISTLLDIKLDLLDIRALSFFSVILVSFTAIFILISRVRSNFDYFIISSSFLYFIFFFLSSGLKFHLIFSIFITVVLFTFYQIFSKKFSFILNVIILSIPVIMFFLVLGNDQGKRGLLADIDYADFINYPTYMAQKLFDDRGGIWIGATKVIKSEIGMFPPTKRIIFDYTDTDGVNVFEFDSGVHNIFLEFILRMGWLLGVFLILLTFYLVIILLNKMARMRHDSHFIFLCSIIIGLIIGGGTTGQYLFLSNFSFILVSLIGISIGYCSKKLNSATEKHFKTFIYSQ